MTDFRLPVQGHQLNPTDLQRLLPGTVDHARLTAAFRVARPARYNMAADTVTRQAHGPRTDAMHQGSWIRTGDFASRDADCYFWYEGRDDDLIKSAGYRIGPAEVEDALVRHAKVAEAAVIGRPDAQRGQIVKAFVRLDEGVQPCDALAAELREHVKQRLAFYKYPRELEFVTSFPLTSTGKINRKALRLAEQ